MRKLVAKRRDKCGSEAFGLWGKREGDDLARQGRYRQHAVVRVQGSVPDRDNSLPAGRPRMLQYL